MRIRVQEGGNKEGVGPLKGFNTFLNGGLGKQPSLSLLIVPVFWRLT